MAKGLCVCVCVYISKGSRACVCMRVRETDVRAYSQRLGSDTSMIFVSPPHTSVTCSGQRRGERMQTGREERESMCVCVCVCVREREIGCESRRDKEST